MTTKQVSIFQTYAQDLLAAEKKSAQALRDHPQIALIIDTLSRKDNHHVILSNIGSDKIKLALLQSIALHLTEGNAPHILRSADFIYFDVQRLIRNSVDEKKIIKDFQTFCSEVEFTNKAVIFAVNDYSRLDVFTQLVDAQQRHPLWRILVINNTSELSGFMPVKLTPPTEQQILALLKTHKEDLESFHQVLIPEETFPAALSMATHYLPKESCFDKTLDLLDSAAARASAIDRNDPTGQFKPLVTSTTLTHIISSWTQIPLTHLHNNSFQTNKFVEALQRRIFGQDTAIATMASVLQHACLKLQEKSGPLCSFLLVGPPEVGKTVAAYTLAEHLFGHHGALLRVNLNETCESISDIRVITNDMPGMTLVNAIQQVPYAIILIENIHQAPAAMISLFKTIFSHGFALDKQGKKYDFSHAIVIATTTLGSERMTALLQTTSPQENNKTIDLMQLVLNVHQPEEAANQHSNLSSQEIYEELVPILENYFSAAFLQHLHIIPFVPLDYAAVEKVVRFKVKALTKRLEGLFGIELNYAPEVIKFLAQEVLKRKPASKPIEKILSQHLYSAVANELLAHADDKNRSRRLFLQLNDNGQLLRCEFINAMNAAAYNL